MFYHPTVARNDRTRQEPAGVRQEQKTEIFSSESQKTQTGDLGVTTSIPTTVVAHKMQHKEPLIVQHVQPLRVAVAPLVISRGTHHVRE